MKYENANNILPSYIVEMIQEYTDGRYLYIPRKDDNKNIGQKKVDLEKNYTIEIGK